MAPQHPAATLGRGKLVAGVLAVLVVVGGALGVTISYLADSGDSDAEPAWVKSEPGSAQIDPLLKAAREGEAEAQYRLGRSLLYDTTRGKKGAAEAVEWLRKAADAGHTGAMVQLGRLYRTGLGVLQNFDLTVEWMHKAADRGDPEGMMEVGRLYRSGTGVKQDLIMAYAWFNRAAAALHTEAVNERDNVALRLSETELKQAQARSAMDRVDVAGEIASSSEALAGQSRPSM